MSAEPTVSVVVVRVSHNDSLAPTLQALASQRHAHVLDEVVVVQHDARPRPVCEELRAHVRTVCCPNGEGFSALRAAGVRAARGALIALTEDHCVPNENWLQAIVEAHEQTRVVGGSIDPAPGLAGVELACYLLAYARYGSTRAAGATVALSDCNVSYAREVLERVREVWERDFVETDVHAALLALGISMRFEPGMNVTQRRRIAVHDLIEEQRVHGAEYGRGRGARMGPIARAARAGASFALPAVATLRALRGGSSLGVGRLLTAVPALWRLAAAWSAGERRGYLSRQLA